MKRTDTLWAPCEQESTVDAAITDSLGDYATPKITGLKYGEAWSGRVRATVHVTLHWQSRDDEHVAIEVCWTRRKISGQHVDVLEFRDHLDQWQGFEWFAAWLHARPATDG